MFKTNWYVTPNKTKYYAVKYMYKNSNGIVWLVALHDTDRQKNIKKLFDWFWWCKLQTKFYNYKFFSTKIVVWNKCMSSYVSGMSVFFAGLNV